MSGKALNWARKISLPSGEKSLLLVLASSFNDDKGYCHPKNKTLAKWCSCSERSVRRYIKSLISKNLIQKEEIRNQLGHRVTFKYTLNFDLNLDSLPDNLSCGKVQSLPDNLSTLPDTVSKPTGQPVRKDYIINKIINKKRNNDFSLVDNFNEQKTGTVLGVKFKQLIKIFKDGYDLHNAEKLFKKLCLENEQPLQFADNLILARKQQKIDFEKLTVAQKFVAAPCSLTNWLKGKRWLDTIKSLGDKKKLSPYVKCKCGEEYLKGSYCRRCAELKKPRVAYA